MSAEYMKIETTEIDGKTYVDFESYANLYRAYEKVTKELDAQKNCVMPNYEGEYHRLLEINKQMENDFIAKEKRYRAQISELGHELTEYSNKWSVIELIFGRR